MSWKLYTVSFCFSAALVAAGCGSSSSSPITGNGGSEEAGEAGMTGAGHAGTAGTTHGSGGEMNGAAGASGAVGEGGEGGAPEGVAGAGGEAGSAFEACTATSCLNAGTCLTSGLCMCPATYTGANCGTDVNECLTANGACDALTTCTNTVGGHTCGACPSGYTGTGDTSCVDINECLTANGGCDALTTCTNTPGARTCSACPSGYTGTGDTSCVDINECLTANGGCDALTTCTNTPGGRTCGACPTGYTGTGEVPCVDVDQDNDGVLDANDLCPNTAAAAVVNANGCSDAQLTATLNPAFPPYGLTFVSSGNQGRPLGKTWSYSTIAKGGLFHIFWLPMDDPANAPYGLSLDGPIAGPEAWAFSAADSNLASGTLVYYAATHINLLTGVTAVQGRLTLKVTAGGNPVPVQTVAGLGVTPRLAAYGVEITGTSFQVNMIAEIQTGATTWQPYADYFDAASKAAGDTNAATFSFGGSFYDK